MNGDNPALNAVIDDVVRSCFDEIGRCMTYTRKYTNNIRNLQVELKNMEDSRVTILREVCIAAENAQDIRQDVLGWLEICKDLKNKMDEFLEKPRNFHLICLCCICPNLKSRYLASSEAAEIASLITQHLKKVEFGNVGQQPQLDQLPLLSLGVFYDFGSRVEIMEEVMDDLKNDSLSIIGLCGMGGIGKTTLVKQIAEEAKKKKIIDEVAFVVVPKEPTITTVQDQTIKAIQVQTIKAIQDQLASRLRLTTIGNETDILERATLVHRRLLIEKKKILVLLDDVWQKT